MICAAIVFVLVGCKKNTIDNGNSNQAPVIKSINLEKELFGLNQKTIITATVSDPENDQFTLRWSFDDTIVTQNELWLYFLSVGDKSITLTATDANGNSSSKSASFKVIDSDIGFGVWYDNLEIIRRSEVSPLVDIGFDRYTATGGGLPKRQYDFRNDSLIRGITSRWYTPAVYQPTQYAIAWTLHQENLDNLTNRFGEPSSIEYSMALTGDPIEDGLNLINGMQVEAHYANERSNATYRVHQDGAATVLYQINYSPK